MKTIMLIDDDKMFNFLNKRIVEKMQAFDQIALFDNAKMALEDIQNMIPEFILLDLMMPLMNGFEFLEELQKLPEGTIKNIKVVVLSSSLVDEDYKRSMQYPNVVGFLSKPLDAEKIKPYLE